MDRLQAALPEILAGYCSKSDKPKEEAEQEAKTFLKIIEDSSNYMFGFNHSTGYSMIGYVCGYLRYYYPKEFITAYLNNASNADDINMGTQLAESMGINIHTIRFRNSLSKYSCNENGIYKGIESIKYMNDKVAYELYELRNKEYDCFIDLLIDIDELSVDSRQMDILIKLNFFEEFGDINFLLEQVAWFNKLYGKKQLSMKKVEELKIPVDVVTKYAGKVTAKTFSQLDVTGLLKDIVSMIVVKKATIKDKLGYELEHLGYLVSVCENINKRYYYVCNIRNTKSLTIIQLYEIYSGKTREVKMWTSQFNKCPFSEKDILYISAINKKHKKEPTGEINPITGKKIYADVPDKFEYWLEGYRIDNELGDIND